MEVRKRKYYSFGHLNLFCSLEIFSFFSSEKKFLFPNKTITWKMSRMKPVRGQKMKIIQIIENSMILGIAYTACYKMSSRNERACEVERAWGRGGKTGKQQSSVRHLEALFTLGQARGHSEAILWNCWSAFLSFRLSANHLLFSQKKCANFASFQVSLLAHERWKSYGKVRLEKISTHISITIYAEYYAILRRSLRKNQRFCCVRNCAENTIVQSTRPMHEQSLQRLALFTWLNGQRPNCKLHNLRNNIGQLYYCCFNRIYEVSQSLSFSPNKPSFVSCCFPWASAFALRQVLMSVTFS